MSVEDDQNDKMIIHVRQALDGDLGWEKRRIAMEGVRLIDLLLRKNSDYGSSVFRPSYLVPSLSTDVLIRVRMSDKLLRLQRLFDKPCERQVEESIEDTMRDLAGYAILWLARDMQDDENDD